MWNAGPETQLTRHKSLKQKRPVFSRIRKQHEQAWPDRRQYIESSRHLSYSRYTAGWWCENKCYDVLGLLEVMCFIDSAPLTDAYLFLTMLNPPFRYIPCLAILKSGRGGMTMREI